MPRVPLTLLLLLVGALTALAGDPSPIAVFGEPGFPAADAAAPSPAELGAWLPGARLVGVGDLKAALSDAQLLVLPYGSAFPEAAWGDIHAFLKAGGHLLAVGGRPFTRSAYRDEAGWHLRDYSVRFTRALLIDQYQETPGSEGLTFETNPDAPPALAPFPWMRAYSPVLHLSSVEEPYPRGGGAGALDARLDALAWGVKDGRTLAAPVLQIDHVRNAFAGGRWIFLCANTGRTPFEPGLVRALADRALEGASELTARPAHPLFLPGEVVPVDVHWQSARAPRDRLFLELLRTPEGGSSEDRAWTRETYVADRRVTLLPPTTPGLHVIEARMFEGKSLRAVYRTGFWIRDSALLKSGPRLSVNEDYFEQDGKPFAVVGTTYMSSEVQRLFFDHPNVYVWDRDMRAIRAAGFNMLRTGWWTGWTRFYDESGVPTEHTRRTIEAYLMTARKHGLPVQWNLFAFIPEGAPGLHPYLDPASVRKQQTFASSLVSHLRDVPFLAWDLINEPSFSERLWLLRPQGDAVERQKWNEWLRARYPDRAALAAAWSVPAASLADETPVPEEAEFDARAAYGGRSALAVYDFFLFGQDVFVGWVKGMREAMRGAGSSPLVTVGQDEGGVQDRLLVSHFADAVDFTTNHTWWQNDHLLWSSVVAKQPGRAMLVQETGLQRELHLDAVVRRDPDAEAQLLERKLAAAFIHGAGAIEWLWNVNAYMTQGNETPIGLVRPDGTEKPEAAVMRGYAGFAGALGAYLRRPERPSVAVVTSQAAQFSVRNDLQLQAQKSAVRALGYRARLPVYAIAENQIEKLGAPALVILPSPQALTEKAWQALLTYAKSGGALLVTGAVDRDEHWHAVPRLAELAPRARVEPLMFHEATLRLPHREVAMSFDQQKQEALESVRFDDGATLREIPLEKGRVFWAAYPVELADGEGAAGDLYRYVAERVGIAPPFELGRPLSPGVLAYPVVLEDAVLYVMMSDAADTAIVDLKDKRTGVRLSLSLGGQRAALALIDAKKKAIVARYGF